MKPSTFKALRLLVFLTLGAAIGYGLAAGASAYSAADRAAAPDELLDCCEDVSKAQLIVAGQSSQETVPKTAVVSPSSHPSAE